MTLETPTTATAMKQASLKRLVFPATGESGSFNEEKEWDRITAELERADKEAPVPTASNQYHVHYLPPGQGEPGRSPMDPINFIPIFLPLDDALLATRLHEEVESLFSLYGTEGVENLSACIELSRNRKHANLIEGYPADIAQYEERYTSSEEIEAASRKVFLEFDRQASALRKITSKLLPTVQAKAVALADKQLEDAGNQILCEATRYLAMNTRTLDAARDLLESTEHLADIILRGPDVPELADAIRRIQTREAALESETLRNSQETSSLEQATNALALTTIVKCYEFPILHRVRQQVYLTDDVLVNTYLHDEPTLLASTIKGNLTISKLKTAIFTTLHEAWHDNLALREDIKSNPAIVWSFRPLIDNTLDQLSHADSSFGALTIGNQAAIERLEAEEAMSLASILSLMTGILDMTANVAWATPPVLFYLAIASLVLSSIETIQQFFKLRREDRAFNAVLDPTKALSSEPGYGWFCFSVVCTMLDIKGVRDALRTMRYASEVVALQKMAGDVSL